MSAGDDRHDGKAAAFFDVDGTLTKTTIVHFYIYFRRRRMPSWLGALWQALYMLKCVYYLVLDKISRSRLNIVFYRTYGGMPASDIRAFARDLHSDFLRPRLFREAPGCVGEHAKEGRVVVFVTGSIDFIVQPLAEELGAKDVLARALVEEDGVFTGELDGPPVGDEEKARLMKQYAQAHDIDLSASFGYGDSIADLPMLETVGHPQVVNPDRALEAVARSRGWPIHCWTIGTNSGDPRS